MIRIKDVKKSFGTVTAFSSTMDIPKGGVYGLLGTNGAGKSTLLRLLSGILRPDEGDLLVDGESIYENEKAKQNLFLVSDDAYIYPGATGLSLCSYLETLYPSFQIDRFLDLMHRFSLDERKSIRSFSKGMKKQLWVLLGIAAQTPYLLCDETFDGLDPVMRQAIKSLFASEVCSRDFTPIIATHNLRELEDFCDNFALLHKGEILLEGNLDEKKQNIHRVQCALADETQEAALCERLDTVGVHRQGKLLLITARGGQEEIEKILATFSPLYGEVVPLTLEELFIAETEAIGYEVNLL